MDSKTSFFFLVLALISALKLKLVIASCEQDALGLQKGFILDVQITASSELNSNTPAKNGRLNYMAGSSWCASTSDSNPYLEIDLQSLHIICAVSTQGNSQADQWVETYSLQSSTNGKTWKDYKQHGQVDKKSFSGNYDRNSAVKYILYGGIVARYVRFLIVTKHGGACLRAEVFGAPRSNRKDLARNQPTEQVSTAHGGSAALAVDGNTEKRFGVRKAQCTLTNWATNAWWRVDLGSSVPVAEVVIVNRLCTSEEECYRWMDSFEIRIGNSNHTNTSCGGTQSMTSGETKSFYCYPPIIGRYVSVVIPGNRKTMSICEVSVYSTRQTSNNVTACAINPVGVSDSKIIYEWRFSASSSLNTSAAPSEGRLKGSSAWKPSRNNNNDYLQIDLGSVYFVCAVATQGNPSANDWTKTYKIETSLDNINWEMYRENNITKTFTGNSDRNGIVRSDVYKPLAVKFIRFYPVLFNNYKALRVEVYGSMQGCLSTMGSERRPVSFKAVSVSASSELDGTHTHGYSRLYGVTSWCSKVSSPPHYLEFRFGKVITLSGIATQGDNQVDKWVTNYTISYGYDGQSWLNYRGGQSFTGNRDKRSVVFRWFSSPFAAQYVRILPDAYHGGVCMRVDLFGCIDFQVPFLFVRIDNATLQALPGASVTLNCIAKFSNQRPPSTTYEWSKDGVKMAESSSSLRITYSNASDINKKYSCSRLSSSIRDVQCKASYQCSKSLLGSPVVKDHATSYVTVILKLPAPPNVAVTNLRARAALVTWNHSTGSDEAPVDSFTLRYQNTPSSDIILPGDSSRKELTNLKPYTNYNVRMIASSAFGYSAWSSAVNFQTSTARPSIAPRNIISQQLNDTTFKISWDPLAREKSNGKVVAYEVRHTKVVSGGIKISSPKAFYLNATTTTFVFLHDLTSCSQYSVDVRAYTSAGPGSFGSLRSRIVTSAPGPPSNVETGTAGKRSITLHWKKPVPYGDAVKTYTVMYEGTKNYYRGFNHSGSAETTALTLDVKNLYPDTKYNFIVIATTQCGDGGNSSVVTSQTLLAAPQAPVLQEVQCMTTCQTLVLLKVWHALQINGPISLYQVLVHRVKEWTDTVSNWKNMTDDFYISLQIPASSVNSSTVVVVGDENTYDGYVNKKLAYGQKYKIYSRGLTIKPTAKPGEQEYLIGEARIIANVAVTKDEQEKAQNDNSSGTGTSLVSVVFNILLGILLGLSVGCIAYLWKRLKRVPNAGEKYSPGEKDVHDSTDYEPVDAGGHCPSQEPSNYIELQPTCTTNREPPATALQHESAISQYQPLSVYDDIIA